MRRDEFPIIDKYVQKQVKDVLDKIIEEIEQVENEIIIDDKDLDEGKRIAFEYVYEIIDKYKESEK